MDPSMTLRATVVIPTYNRPHLLARLLGCLTHQTGEAVAEVLVCDDGSSTDTNSVMEPYYGRIPGLRRLWQDDLGFRAGQARNMGIKEAKGDVVIFVDDDVLLSTGFVESHLKLHQPGGRQVVLGFRHRSRVPPADTCPTLDEMVLGDPDDRIEPLGLDGDLLPQSDTPWFYVYSCNFSAPRLPELWFDEDFEGWGMEDVELGYRLFFAGYKIAVQPSARVLHVEDPMPRDPFRCVERGLQPHYDTYVHNMVRFINKYPGDGRLRELLSAELRWYVRDGTDSHWVKNGEENSVEEVMHRVHRLEASHRRVS